MSLIKYSSFSNKATKAAATTATIVAAASSSSVVASFFLGTSTSTTRALQTADHSVGINSNDENDRILEKNVKSNNTAVRLSTPPITEKASTSFSTATDISTRNFSTTTTNSDTPTSTNTWQPNQTTSTFTKMQSTCPDLMKAYAQCVIQKQNEGVLEQGACEVEYEQLMDCFRMVRSSC